MPVLVHFPLELTHLLLFGHWWSCGKSIGGLWCSFWIYSAFYYAQYLPTYHMTCSKTTSFSFTTYTYSKGLTCLWNNELLFTSLPENDSSPVLEAFTWFWVPLNINHNQKASNLYKWQDTHRNQEYNLLYFLHPLPMSPNAISFPKTQRWQVSPPTISEVFHWP